MYNSSSNVDSLPPEMEIAPPRERPQKRATDATRWSDRSFVEEVDMAKGNVMYRLYKRMRTDVNTLALSKRENEK